MNGDTWIFLALCGALLVFLLMASFLSKSYSLNNIKSKTVGETVVRMLHHMSGIFEDNSKIDQIHRGLQIDRKRRQELQRKRLAMGHKPDDHEEQMFR